MQEPATFVLEEIQRGEGFRSRKLTSACGVELDPFLSFEHFHMRDPTFAPHPHAGLAAVTYLFERSEGSLLSRESSGETRRIGPGAVRVMEAARGMMHEESPLTRGRDCHGMQILVNLAAIDKRGAPRVLHLDPHQIPSIAPRPGVRVRVVSGREGEACSPLTPRTPFTLLDVLLAPGASLAHAIARDEAAFVVSLHGGGEVGPPESAARLGPHMAAALARGGDQVTVRAGASGWHVLLAAGRPLGETVVLEGPFAMTSREEIADAWARHTRGEMGALTPSS
jgi:redox-sensitive bicupin YhaK (pirin superfamily)